MAGFVVHDDWASPEERADVHPSISALADAFIAARTPWPQTVARGTFFVFGPASVFARIGRAPDEPAAVSDLLEEMQRIDVMPHDGTGESGFSAVVLPAWKRAYPEYAADWDIPLGSAIPVRESRRANRLHAVAVELLAMQVTMGKLRREILALPGVTALNAYLGRPVWRRMLAFLGERADASGPSCVSPEVGEFKTYSPSDDYEYVHAGSAKEAGIPRLMHIPRLDAEPLQRVRAIYREMDGSRQFDTSHRGSSYTRGIPPQDKRVTKPTKLASTTLKARTLWFQEVYGLYVQGFLATSLRVAHLEFLAPFYVDPGGSTVSSRARAVLMRLSVDWAYQRGPRAILDQLASELTHPGVAYTHPMTTDEARCWVLCALEHIYATNVATARVPVGVNEAAMDADRLVKQWARMYSATLAETVVDPVELARLMTIGGKRVDTHWLEGVRAEWSALHAADYVEDSAEQEMTEWLEQLQTAMTENNVVSDLATMPSMQTHLDEVAGIAWARFFMATFHEDHPPTSTDGTTVDVAREIERTTSIPYALRLTHLATPIAQATELEDFLGRVWLPMTCTRSSPDLLYSVNTRLPMLRIDSESDAVVSGEDTRVADSAGVYIPPAEVTDVPDPGVARYLFSTQRDVLARYNWHAEFFERWAGHNTRELSGRLAYVARLDAYEADAANHDLRLRGKTVLHARAFTAADMERIWFASPVEKWPLYKEWTNMRIMWRVLATVGDGGREILVYDNEFDDHARVMHPPEIRGLSILTALRDACSGPVSDDTHVHLECTVRGTFLTARPSTTTETVEATGSCIFTVRKE